MTVAACPLAAVTINKNRKHAIASLSVNFINTPCSRTVGLNVFFGQRRIYTRLPSVEPVQRNIVPCPLTRIPYQDFRFEHPVAIFCTDLSRDQENNIPRSENLSLCRYSQQLRSAPA